MNAAFVRRDDPTSTISSFFFRPSRPLRYIAGQFVEISLPHAHPDSRGVKRWFTLSSAPGHELVSITTKRAHTSSSFKKALWTLEQGENVSISEPMGDFVLPKNSKQPLLFIAGGIGITPFHSIVEWLIENNQERTIQFVYSVHTKNELVFVDTFAQPFIEKFERVAQPNLTVTKLVSLVKGIEGKQIFISGPEPMTEALVAQFKKEYGMTQDQLITDYFPGYTL